MSILSSSIQAQNISLSLPLAPTVGVQYTGNKPNSGDYRSVAPAGDFNGDGVDDIVIGDSRNASYSGGGFIVLGKGGDQTSLDLPSLSSDHARGFRITAPGGTQVGTYVSPAGDFNNDGFDDVLLASHGSGTYLVWGKPGPFSDLNLDTFSSPNPNGIRIFTNGFYATGLGDVNGDGIDDIAVSYNEAVYNPYIGTTYVYKDLVAFGKSGAQSDIDVLTYPTSEATGFRMSASQGDRSPVPVGDFNGDGFADVLVGSETSVIVYGKPSGHIDVNLQDAVSSGAATRVHAMCAASFRNLSPADYNGDGLSDVLLGTRCSQGQTGRKGTIYVVYGRTDIPATIDVHEFDTSNSYGFRIDGIDGEGAGDMVANTEDFNGDGFSDIFLDASAADYAGPGSGSAYLIYGRATAQAQNIDLASAQMPGPLGFRIDGTTYGGKTPISPAGDVNDDGLSDVIFQETQSSPTGSVGVNYILFGRAGAQSSIANWSLYHRNPVID